MKLQGSNRKKEIRALVIIIILEVIVSITTIIVMNNKLDSSIPKYTDYTKEKEELNKTISENGFYGKDVYIVTTIQTLEVEEVEEIGDNYKLKTHYGYVDEENWSKEYECVTVYKNLDNKLEDIKNIASDEDIKYIVDGYKRKGDNTLIIKSDTNKKKYREYINSIKRLRQIEEDEKLNKNNISLIKKRINIVKYIEALVFVIVQIWVVSNVKSDMRERKKK